MRLLSCWIEILTEIVLIRNIAINFAVAKQTGRFEKTHALRASCPQVLVNGLEILADVIIGRHRIVII